MTVTAQIPYNASTAAPGATVFPYGFKIVSATDMRVLVDGVVKSYPADYAVSGVGVDAGGDVTLTVPLLGGEKVLVKSDMAYERATDYQQLGDLHSDTLNNDQDSPVLMIRQLAGKFDQTLQVSEELLGRFNTTISGPLVPLGPLVINAAGTGVESGSTTLTGDMLLRGNLAADGGGALVSFKQTGTGAQLRSLQEKAQDNLCILDWIPAIERAAILAGTSLFDATTYVQAAVNAAIVARRALYAPGHYRLTAPIVITGSLTIYGDGNEMLIDFTADVQTRGKGSWFYLDHSGLGFYVNPTMHRSGINFECFGTYRTQPATTPGPFTPAAHDYDFSLKNADVLFKDMSLYNPTKGILNWGGTRLSIERLRGQPLAEGVNINDAGDTCRIRDVHFWPFFSNSAPVRAWLRANAKAVILKDVDNPDLTGIFTLGYADGVACEPLAGTLAMPLKVRLSNFDFDNGGYGFRIASGGINGVTAILSHGFILGVSVGGPANASNIDIGGNNNSIMIDNVGLDLPQDCNVKVSGTGNQVRGSSWAVGRWNFDAGASFGIEVGAGNTLRLSNSPIITAAGTTTAIFGGAGTISCPLGSGVVTQTTDASGFITVTHGLGIAPRVIVANGQSGTAYAVYPTTAKNATTFGAQLRTPSTGAVVASTSVTVEWQAWY